MIDQAFNERPPAIVLGGSANAVSVVRALSARGIAVHAVGDRPDRPVRWSRHLASFTDLGGSEPRSGYLEWLSTGPRTGVVIPCDDDAVELLARDRAQMLDMGYRPIEAADDVLLAMLDKRRSYALAAEAGVATPKVLVLRSEDDLDAAIDDISYPCVLKPVQGHVFRRVVGTLSKVIVATSRRELEESVRPALALGVELMVTEVIPGEDDQLCSYYSYLDERGEPLFHLTKHKLRQFPPRFGLACYEITDWNPEVAHEGLRFFRSIGLRGLGNVEFKRDPRDGTLKLIECNARLTAANELVRRAGIDLALLAYGRALGWSLSPERDYERGLRLWRPIEDARSFLAQRELSAASWLRSILHRQVLPVASWDDPMPTLAFHAARLRAGRPRPQPAPRVEQPVAAGRNGAGPVDGSSSDNGNGAYHRRAIEGDESRPKEART